MYYDKNKKAVKKEYVTTINDIHNYFSYDLRDYILWTMGSMTKHYENGSIFTAYPCFDDDGLFIGVEFDEDDGDEGDTSDYYDEGR